MITDEKGDPWFVAKDVCGVLGYGNTSAAISKHCKHAQNVSITKRDTGGGGRDIRIIIPQGDVVRPLLDDPPVPQARGKGVQAVDRP